MAEYEYEAESASGEKVRGFVTAHNEFSARSDLASRGIHVTHLASTSVGTPRDDDNSRLVHAVGAAATYRLPLELSLAVLAEDKSDPRLAAVAASLAKRLEQGEPIDTAVAALVDQLPADFRGLMRAGVESNNLAGAFARYSEQRLATERLYRQIRAALTYPLLVLAILVPVVLFLSIYVIPMFAGIYEDADLVMPAMTELILQTSAQLPGLTLGLLALVVAVPIVVQLFGGRWLFHRFRASIPMVGQLWMWAGQREFASLLAAFLDERMPMTKAVTFTGELLSDRNIANSCRRLNERLENGESLGDSLAHSINFDRGLVATATWGEMHGVLPDALRIAAEVFDDRIEQQISMVRRLLPPIALVAVGSLLMFAVIGLFAPLIDLIQSLSM